MSERRKEMRIRIEVQEAHRESTSEYTEIWNRGFLNNSNPKCQKDSKLEVSKTKKKACIESKVFISTSDVKSSKTAQKSKKNLK